MTSAGRTSFCAVCTRAIYLTRVSPRLSGNSNVRLICNRGFPSIVKSRQPDTFIARVRKETIMRAFFVRYFPRILGAALAATALALPAVSLAQSQDEQIHGKIQSIEGTFNLSIAGDDGYLDSVAVQQDTTINPTGLALAPGMEVTVTGYPSGSVFTAVEIDAPYKYSGPPPVPVYYGPGAWYPGYAFGYGPSFSIGISFDGSGAYSAHREPWTGSWIANSAPSTYQNGSVSGGYGPDSGDGSGGPPPMGSGPALPPPAASSSAPLNAPSQAPVPLGPTAGVPVGGLAPNVSGAPVSLFVPGGSPVNVYIQGASPAGGYAAAGTTASGNAPAAASSLDDLGNDFPGGAQSSIYRQAPTGPGAGPNASATYAESAPVSGYFGRGVAAYGQALRPDRAAPMVLPSYAYLPGTYRAPPAVLPPYAISPDRYRVATQAPGYLVTTVGSGYYSGATGYQH